ncbi:hypothetical protein ABEB36_015622 [Hypothenemus hampei]|uniref:Retrotransposon gag domain-containing protein n=1 Tax=Hypothenemus hampei TaxID=57062 RepID=A0ABD1DZD5_HYPHA
MQNNQNITLANALNRPREPASPRFMAPTTFNPSSSQVVSFLSHYEAAANCNGWDDAYKIMYYRNFLDGPANEWYQQYAGDIANSNNNWQAIKAAFRKEFLGRQYRALQLRLANKRQTATETLRKYC